jgi:hypothetical protein
MPGVTEAVKVVVFTNKNRDKNERAPDYVVYRSEDADSTAKVEQVAEQAAGEVSEQTQASAAEQQQDKDIPEELF